MLSTTFHKSSCTYTHFLEQAIYAAQQYASWMTSCDASFTNCSRRCQTRAAIRSSHDVSGSFRTVADERYPAVQRSVAMWQRTHANDTALTRMIPHCARVNLLHVYRSLPIANVPFIMDRLRGIVFTVLTSDQHVCLRYAARFVLGAVQTLAHPPGYGPA